jgi:Domain of unknown function (DUF1844)
MPKDQNPDVEVTVRDRRMFNPDGTLRQPITTEEPVSITEPPIITPSETTPATTPSAAAIPAPPAEPSEDDRTEGISPEFASLLQMLATNTILQLGAESQFGRGQIDLEAARHFIDIIAVLQEKTAGNLSLDEQNMLNSMLSRLRMDYVGVVNQMNKSAKSS